MELSGGKKKFHDMFSRFVEIPACDEQTNGIALFARAFISYARDPYAKLFVSKLIANGQS